MDSKRKKWLVASIAAGVVIAGTVGYYTYSHNSKTNTATHANHQAGATISVNGESVKLDAKARQLAGVQTAAVTSKQLIKEIKTTGKIAIDETNRTYLSSRVEGRVDELYVTAEGQYVSAGQTIASVYSPTYITAQEEYLAALDTVQKLKNAAKEITQANNKLLDAAKRKILLLGLGNDEIARLEQTRQVNTHMAIYAQFGGTVMEKQTAPGAYIMPGDKLFALADLSSVWMYADVYENDLANIRRGQEVIISSSAYPGEDFSGSVTFINPLIDDATRAAKVRVGLPSYGGKLKPNLFVNAFIRIPLEESLVIPSSSLLDTGTRKIVFVQKDEETFVKRDIVTGQEVDGFIQVISGLQPNETVVTAATFLIDSQTQLGNFGSHAGHGGGGQKASAPASAPQNTLQPPATSSVPATGSDHSGHSGH